MNSQITNNFVPLSQVIAETKQHQLEIVGERISKGKIQNYLDAVCGGTEQDCELNMITDIEQLIQEEETKNH